ncbi:MAG: translation initiation factor [Schleiferiaceae bacterium]
MAKKRIDRSASGPGVSSNPFADALANALAVEEPQSSERMAWNEDEEALDGPGSKWVHIGFEKKGRGGKTVTLVTFQNPATDAAEWAKKLKTRLGVGGSVDPDGIVLQGDVRTKAEAFLQAEGYKTKRIGG